VALAGDHAQSDRETWRELATQIYAFGLAGLSACLLIFFPLKFDLRVATIVQVAIVAIFLVLMERPSRTPATNVAPLTALMAAGGVVFGPWLVVLAGLTGLAIRWRIVHGEGGRWRDLLVPQTLIQVCNMVIASYAVMATWSGMEKLLKHLPHSLTLFATFPAILLVGLAWQTTSNSITKVYLLIHGRSASLTQMIRIGIVASIYAYLLVAMYGFGGLVATTVFYVVVAQIRVLQDVLSITNSLHKLEHAQIQAQGLTKDLVRLTDTEEVEFASEVQNISQMLGRRLGMSKTDLQHLDLASQLHEIGKARLPARVRCNSTLNARELAQKQTYPRWGALMIRASDALFPPTIADWIEFHGEHFDGTGYPRGLRGEDIPLQSRIIAVARDYVRFLTGYDGAEKVGKEKALSLLRDGSGTLYDPRLVNLLCELVS
jgi:hypothetical protein